MLGLARKGHLGAGADADITIYQPEDDIQRMFELPRYVIHAGEVVVDGGEIRQHSEGKLLHVAPAYDEACVPDIQAWFEQNYSIQFRNYPVDLSYLHEHEVVGATGGVRESDRVATVAWNGYRHMELYYAVSGSGAVLHTINPRLHPDQVVYIADHAEDQVLFFDLTFLPVIKAIAGRTKTLKTFVAMTDRKHMPKDAGIAGLLCYEELLERESDQLVEKLRSLGRTVEYEVFDDEGHGFTKRPNELKAYRLTVDWLERHLT